MSLGIALKDNVPGTRLDDAPLTSFVSCELTDEKMISQLWRAAGDALISDKTKWKNECMSN